MLFPKAGVPAIDGLIPGKNFVQWAKLIGRPSWWPILLLIPIVNIFILAGMAVNLVRSFGKYKLGHSAASVIYPPASFAWLAKNEEAKYIGPNYIAEKAYLNQLKETRAAGDKIKLTRLTEKSPYKKSAAREWTESIFFAVFAAAFIRMFLIEAFVIPTPSMEGSLMVGDFLFVSKASYGIRTPMTLAMVPLLHNRIPIIGKECYFKKPSLKYHRLPAIPSQMQFLNKVDKKPPGGFSKEIKNWGIGDTKSDLAGSYGFYLTEEQREKLQAIDGASLSYHKSPIDGPKLFPHDAKITKGWSVDNYGPVWIPKAGATVKLSKSNIAFYRRIIDVYEHNDLVEKNGQFIINGEATDSYTFKQDYYWAMGDNRHNSEDSRMWGPVPHDHIVGKPLFIWFSTRNARIFDGIRFNRMFKSANVE